MPTAAPCRAAPHRAEPAGAVESWAEDDPGPFKRWVGYAWGQIRSGPSSANVDKPRKKKKRSHASVGNAS